MTGKRLLFHFQLFFQWPRPLLAERSRKRRMYFQAKAIHVNKNFFPDRRGHLLVQKSH